MTCAYLDLFLRPVVRPVKHAKRESRQPRYEISLPHAADILKPLVFGPAVGRHLKDLLVHVHKPHALVNLPQPVRHDRRPVANVPRGGHFVEPPRERRVGPQRAVVAAHDAVVLLRLEPPARLQVLKRLSGDLLLKRGPAARCYSRVDVVVLLGKLPRLGSVLSALPEATIV